MGLLGSIVVEYLLLPVGTFAECVGIRIRERLAVRQGTPVHHDGVLGGVHHVVLLPGVLPSAGKIILYARRALLSRLGGDKDHTVGRAGAVDGSGCGVLEDFDGKDITGIDVVDASSDGHTVNYIQRVAVVDGTDTADADLRGCTGLSG